MALLDSAKPFADAVKSGSRSYLFYGAGGTGKTLLATKHPGKRKLWLDMDEKLHELLPQLTPAEQQAITIWKPEETLGSDFVQIFEVDPQRKDTQKGVKIASQPMGFKKLVDVTNELLKLAYEAKKGGPPFPYDLVVADSATRISDHLEYATLYAHNMTTMTETLFGIFGRNFKEWLNGFLQLPCDRILIAHTKHVEKRAKDNPGMILQSYTRPYVLGGTSENLNTFFSEAYFFLGRKPGAGEGGKAGYIIQTATDREAPARTANPKLAFEQLIDPKAIFGSL